MPDSSAHGEDRLRRLAELSRRLAAETDLSPVLADMVRFAISLTGAERGFFLAGRRSNLLCEAAVPGPPPAAGTAPREMSSGVIARALDGREAVVSIDLPGDSRFRARASVRRLALKSVLAVPANCREGSAGVLYLDSRAGRADFRSHDLELLRVLTAQASLAVHCRASTPASLESLSERPRDGPALSRIIGGSSAIRRVRETIARVAMSDVPVLIVGESGTGKELVALAIHQASARRAGPFVAENCAAIPETLLESELFGAVRGAFTGAERDREGLFRSANGGTLFLDELAEMPLPFQARLLRVLQESEVRPLGSSRTLRVNARILAATNRDPALALATGRLRPDLYYRTAGLLVELPPLRDRREDIAELASHFLGRAAGARGACRRSLAPDALDRLASYSWPGNVRELENEMHRAALLVSGDTIGAGDLSLRLGRGGPLSAAPAEQPAERTMIEAALASQGGNLTRAARSIGWSRQKLYRRMASLEVPRRYGCRWHGGCR